MLAVSVNGIASTENFSKKGIKLAYKFNKKDVLQLRAKCKAISDKWVRGEYLLECYDVWDDLYGQPPLDYEVYVLTDPTSPMIVEFPPFLYFHHRPFYIGRGKMGVRSVRSAKFSIQEKDGYDYKTKILREINARGGRAIPIIIGNFYTEEKSIVVERKLMRTIHITFQEGNSYRNLCEIPLTKEDCNVIYHEPGYIKPVAC